MPVEMVISCTAGLSERSWEPHGAWTPGAEGQSGLAAAGESLPAAPRGWWGLPGDSGKRQASKKVVRPEHLGNAR